MQKTDKQLMLEAQKGKDIMDILCDLLSKHRGEMRLIPNVAFELQLTDATIYNWCESLGIDIDDYKQPVGVSPEEQG